MDRIEIYQEIRSMQIAYSFHFVFYIILGIEHLLIILKIFWNNNTHKKIFITFSIIDLVILFYPIIPLVLMYRIILKRNLTKIFKFISLILIISSLIFGLIIAIFYWINLKSTTIFSKECPYNINDISRFTTDENSSDKCGKRRCVLESIKDKYEDYPYNYICNYNSQGEFEVDPTKQYPVTAQDGSVHYIRFFIQCEQKNNIDELFTDDINKNNQILTYLQKCWNNNDVKGFYFCKRYEYPDKFNIDDEYKCPESNYNTILYLSGIFLIVLDILLAFIPWSFDYKSYSTLLSFENIEDENVQINDNNNNQARHNETNTSSHNRNGGENNQDENGSENNNQNDNNNIGSENNERNDFIHQPTETIIIVKDKKTNNNSSNIKSSDRLNSGLNSNDMSKSNVANNSNSVKKKNKKNENIVGSLISQSESQNMISKTSEKENESEDSKSMGKKKLLLRQNNFINGFDNNIINNENKEIFLNNNNIKYGQYHNDDDEDEKDVGNQKEQNNCLIKNKNININNITLNNKNKKQESLNNKPKIKIILTKEERNNINIKETNNSVKTTIVQRNKEEKIENNKNNNNSESGDEIKKFEQIVEDIHENYHTRTPKKELRRLTFNFSQVLTNVRESDQVTLFKNTNGSIIKEERKEETERSKKGKEEEKNNSNASKNDKKRINLSSLTPLKLKNKSKDKENKNERKIKSFVKSDSHSSLIIDSNRSYNHSGVEENS